MPLADEFGNPGDMESTWIAIAVAVLLGIALLAAFVALARHRGRSRGSEPTVAEPLAPLPFPGAAARHGLPDADPAMSGVDAGPYPGSARPGPGGAAPSERFLVKAEEADKAYYVPGMPDFAHARADVWFLDAADAESAGFHPATPRAR